MNKEQIINLIKQRLADLDRFIINRAIDLEFPMEESDQLFRPDTNSVVQFEYWDSSDLENHNFDLGGYIHLTNLLKDIENNG